MSLRTSTLSSTKPPPTDRRMWRRVLALCHPDGHGDHETFLWVTNLQEHVAGDAIEPPRTPRYAPQGDNRPERIPFDPMLGYVDDFVDLTHRALSIGRRVEEPHRGVLALLIACPTADRGRRAERQMRGASFKQLAFISHLAGMGKEQRRRWYEICRSIPLSDMHAHHLISRLKEQ